MQIRGHSKKEGYMRNFRAGFFPIPSNGNGVTAGPSEPAFPPYTLDRLNETLVHVMVPPLVGGI